MESDSLKFVRLNLTGEIVEVVRQSVMDVTINYLGETTTLYRHEVTPITPEEETIHINRRKRPGLVEAAKEMRLSREGDEVKLRPHSPNAPPRPSAP